MTTAITLILVVIGLHAFIAFCAVAISRTFSVEYIIERFPLAYSPPLGTIAFQAVLLGLGYFWLSREDYLICLATTFFIILLALHLLNRLWLISWLSYALQAVGFGLIWVLPEQGIYLVLAGLIVLSGDIFSYRPIYYRYDRHVLMSHIKYKNKYHSLIKIHLKSKRLRSVLYCLMIIEDMNRPKAFRLIENIAKKTMLRNTIVSTGLMQVRSDKYVSDADSVIAACKIVRLLDSLTAKHNYPPKQRLRHIVFRYNGDENYVEYFDDIYPIIPKI